jgi:hypothetical protein
MIASWDAAQRRTADIIWFLAMKTLAMKTLAKQTLAK